VSAARAAVFLDRDGTINEDTAYVSRPEDMVLLPRAAPAIARLNDAGLPVVVVSNQSGIGRGYFTREEYDRIAARLDELLRAEGARLDATYICPHAPSDPLACDCRKPATLLFRRAAADLELDLQRSWFIGDRVRDVEPAAALGGRGILLLGPSTPPEDAARASRHFATAVSLWDAVDKVLGGA